MKDERKIFRGYVGYFLLQMGLSVVAEVILKFTRIEGLCSEIMFMEDVVKDNLSPVTGDFWFSRKKKDGKYSIWKIVVNPDSPLATLDYRLLDGFGQARDGIAKVRPEHVSIVYFNEATRSFWEIDFQKGERYPVLMGVGIEKPVPGNGTIPDDEGQDEVRTAKACDFLESRGLLKEMAIKRLFANCGWGLRYGILMLLP